LEFSGLSLLRFAGGEGGSFDLFLCFWRCFFASGPFLGCGVFRWFRVYSGGRFLFSLRGARGEVFGFV